MKEGSAMTEILAIDDDREILAVIKKALLREGYQVTALEDPLQLEEDKLVLYSSGWRSPWTLQTLSKRCNNSGPCERMLRWWILRI